MGRTSELARLAPSIECYQTIDGTLVRVSGDSEILQLLISMPGVSAWWFVDAERTRTAPPVRFAYERLFDPRAREWVRA